MNNQVEMITKIIDILDDTCFPVQINHCNQYLYVRGIKQALEQLNMSLVYDECNKKGEF